ncbi:MAG: 2-amino-4-hydroxy-6-hydroxymethyldihydropteridine diphosphokinase [Actinomycetia bacterium]|nr:2-amino-4-hydroxy-6-hydroxymethyldihydropteridine diphosphokinase [Actinomycetes bacterium]
MINNLKLYGYHGVREHEKKDGQDFIFNICIHIEDKSLKNSDNLEDSLSYSDVIREVNKINKNQKFDLLETLSRVIADEIISMSGLVKKVDVRIEKPSPPIDEELDSVGVEYSLKKDEPDSFPVKVFLSLGSNMGDRKTNLKEALRLLGNNPGISILSISSLYETGPMYVQDQNNFYNIVAEISAGSETGPFKLLGLIKEIEYHIGRKKGGARYGPRPIDIDILYYGNEKIESDILQIPHPGIAERRFVLLPLSEIAPEMEIEGMDIKEYIKNKDLPGKVDLVSGF